MDDLSVVRLWTDAQGPRDGGDPRRPAALSAGAAPRAHRGLNSRCRRHGGGGGRVFYGGAHFGARRIRSSFVSTRSRGVLFTWAFAPPTTAGVVVGFALFRVFDMWKPFPARNLEKLPGGFGIVMDDVAAGCWGAVVLVLLGRLGWV